MSGDEPGVIAITQRELLLEMREDIRGLKATVDAIARDQALGVERRATMQRSADGIVSRLDEHDRELDDLRRWRDRADGAMVLARWALGASLVSLVVVVMQVVATIAKAVNPSLPWTVDHVVPLAAGGAPFDIGNCAVLCRSCNSRKGATTNDRGGVAHRATHMRPDRAQRVCAHGRFRPLWGVFASGVMHER